MDRLSNVLNRFSLNANVFFSGNLCGVQAFEEAHIDHGHLHLLKAGELVIKGDKFNIPFLQKGLYFYNI